MLHYVFKIYNKLRIVYIIKYRMIYKIQQNELLFYQLKANMEHIIESAKTIGLKNSVKRLENFLNDAEKILDRVGDEGGTITSIFIDALKALSVMHFLCITEDIKNKAEVISFIVSKLLYDRYGIYYDILDYYYEFLSLHDLLIIRAGIKKLTISQEYEVYRMAILFRINEHCKIVQAVQYDSLVRH